MLLVTIYFCVGHFAHPDRGASLTSAAESTTEFSKKLGGKRKYLVIFGVVVILVACYKYDLIKKILKGLKPAETPEQPVPSPRPCPKNLPLAIASASVSAIACMITLIVLPELVIGATGVGLSPEIIAVPACAVVGTVITVVFGVIAEENAKYQ